MNCIDYMNDKILKDFRTVSLSGYIICFHAKHNIFQQKNWTPIKFVSLKYIKKSCVVRDETNTFSFGGRRQVTAILLAVTFPNTEKM